MLPSDLQRSRTVEPHPNLTPEPPDMGGLGRQVKHPLVLLRPDPVTTRDLATHCPTRLCDAQTQ